MADVNWDKVAWDEPTQSTPVEEIRKIGDEATAFARWKEEEREKVATAMAHAIRQQTTAPLADQVEQRPGKEVARTSGHPPEDILTLDEATIRFSQKMQMTEAQIKQFADAVWAWLRRLPLPERVHAELFVNCEQQLIFGQAAALAHWKEYEQQQVKTRHQEKIARLVVGDHVRVKDGTFAGFEGPVREVLEAKNQVRVQLSAFRHLATLDLEYWQVERVCPPHSVATGQAEQRPLPEEVKKVVQWADRHGCLEDTVPGHAEWARREGILSEVAKSVQVTEEQVAALPLAEVHPANKGPYLLDEQGNVRTLEATAHPESLHIQVGNLEIYCEGKPGAVGIPFCGNSRILVDGNPFPVKSLVLRGNVDGLWTVELEFYPRQPKE